MAGVAGALNVLPDAELLAVDAAHCSACPKKLTCHQNVSTKTPLVRSFRETDARES